MKASYMLSQKIINGKLNHNIAIRCCNFTLLEEKCKEYNENN